MGKYPDNGACVFRNAGNNFAELQIEMSISRIRTSCCLELGPRALEELAQRLLDAAHDIRTNPAGALGEQPCSSK